MNAARNMKIRFFKNKYERNNVGMTRLVNVELDHTIEKTPGKHVDKSRATKKRRSN